MNFLEQFAKQPISVKLVLLGIIVVVIVVLEVQLYRSPKKDELERLVGETRNLQVQLLESQAIADNLPKFQEEVNILNEQLKQALALLPNEADVHSLYRQLAIVAKKANVDLLVFRPGGQGRRGFYNDLNMEVKLSGTYHDIATFIDLVGKLSRIVNVSNLVFSSARTDGNSIVMNVDCRVTTFMFAGGRK